MKKKFVLTLALVLMVAVTLTAATPLEVSGSFEFGYEFAFGDGAEHKVVDTQKYSTFVSVAGDYWKVNIGKGKGGSVFASGAELAGVTADIYLDKALADEGVDMGDVALTLHLGTNVGAGAPSVFADAADYDDYDAVENPIGIKPVKTTAPTFGLTLGYADLVKVYLATNPTVDDFDAIVGVSASPVDGVEAALGFGVDAKALSVSAAADVATLAGLDFDLDASVLYVGYLDDPKSNDLYVDVAGEYEGIGLYVGFSALNLETFGIRAGASYATEVEGVDLAANVDFAMDDFEAADDFGLSFGASAAYKMGGVTYKLALGYALKGAFTVSPTVAIAW